MSEETIYKILAATKYSNTLSEIGDKLYLSQPYISKVLKKAEKKYQATLIDRKSTPISLTKAGLIVLEHLKIIQKTEEDLFDSLHSNTNAGIPFRILVTNPFLYDLVRDVLTSYTKQNPNFLFELSSYPVENSINILKNNNFDLIIGRKYIDDAVNTLPLPQNQVFGFISNKCVIFDPERKVLPFKNTYLKPLKNTTLVIFENSEGIQNYVLRRFNEVGVEVKNVIKVDTVLDAIKVAKKLGHSAMALTSDYLANENFGANNYNLLKLPDNTLNFDNAILLNKNVNQQVEDLSRYLQKEITSILDQENTNL